MLLNCNQIPQRIFVVYPCIHFIEIRRSMTSLNEGNLFGKPGSSSIHSVGTSLYIDGFGTVA